MPSISTSPADAALANRAAALFAATADALADVTATAAGRGGQAPAALVSLREFLGGASIEQLSQVMGLTHSATVRLVDRLVADGQVAKQRAGDDGRAVRLRLTARGARTAARIADARLQTMEACLRVLSEKDRRALARLTDRLLAGLATARLEARARHELPAGGWLCRSCDFEACGRPAGRCPVAGSAVRDIRRG